LFTLLQQNKRKIIILGTTKIVEWRGEKGMCVIERTIKVKQCLCFCGHDSHAISTFSFFFRKKHIMADFSLCVHRIGRALKVTPWFKIVKKVTIHCNVFKNKSKSRDNSK
jgi:hypothetical protein